MSNSPASGVSRLTWSARTEKTERSEGSSGRPNLSAQASRSSPVAG
jgi:hypothetical protein